jgi:hypothetical protein
MITPVSHSKTIWQSSNPTEVAEQQGVLHFISQLKDPSIVDKIGMMKA